MFHLVRETVRDLVALGSLSLFGMTMLLWSDAIAEVLRP